METISVISTRTRELYILTILQEKDKQEFRICNLSKTYICPCVFNTYEEAYADIVRYEKEGKNIILR